MSEKLRYIVREHHPELVTAYQTARIPDHIEVTEINREGFTATAEAAEQVWVYLTAWETTRQRIEGGPK
jgi:hypothetical protein